MKIKKLSILGFKSFMDRLEITFPFGISGVVGPNGCGKSNIIDAIRWCMGEQSPKQLRGRRMEDIIFSGAGHYKPLGMSEVSILLENGNGTFPTSFTQDTELSVTRRLFRSGESEYMINNVPCRLRDIQEVFMDTGLGNKAYSIIGQGQIGAILEQRPEDTRVMLEEAAGITKYRKKVEISQKKMELTRANVQRVEDISGEIQAQMKSLKRQASKAARYKSISEEIRNLELTLHANIYHQCEKDLGNKQRSTEDLVHKEIAGSTALSKLLAGTETLDLQLEEKDNGLSGLRKNHLHLREQVHKKEADLESLAGEMRMQKELEGRLKNEENEIQSRLIGLKEEKAGIQKQIEEMKANIYELKGETDLKKKRLGSRSDHLKTIREEYEKAREELNVATKKEVGLDHESGYLNKMMHQISDSRSRLEKELEDFTDKTKSIILASEKKSLSREESHEKMRVIEAAIIRQNRNCEELELTKKSIEKDLKSAEAGLNFCQSRLASLQALIENFEGYNIGVRTIMKATDLFPGQQEHIFGLVADFIQVEPEYEQAVEAVLADKLQYIIVESQTDGKLAVDYLKKRAKGRGSFVPLKDLRGDVKGLMRTSQSNFLKDIVSVPGKFSPVIDALLGNTVLVEDLEEAVSAWKNSEGGLCFVTVNGDMIDERGVVSGGKLAQSSVGILARKREMAELKERAGACEREVKGLELKLENTISKIDQKKEELKELTEDKWECQDEINDLDKAVFRLGQELDQLEKLQNRISEDLEKNNREHSKHEKELFRIEEELHQCKANRKEEEGALHKKETELSEAEDEHNHFRDELMGLKADARILGEEQRSLAREKDRLDDYSNEALRRLQKIEEDISLSIKRYDECQSRKEVLGMDLDLLYEKLQKAEEDMNRADLERQEFQDMIREEEKKVENLRREVGDLKEKIAGAKLENSEISFKMSSHVDTIKDRFNLNLAGIYMQHVVENFSAKETEQKLDHQKLLRQRLGEVNLTAIKEHEALTERYEFIKNQREDLINSIEALKEAISKINSTSTTKFIRTFQDVNEKLGEIFPILFNGGTACLKLIDKARPLESGVLVEVRPPGKRLSHMGLLSGGEKALVAMALIFAIYMIKPSPFCLLDEVDAPLDEANVDRFNDLLTKIKDYSQIIMVTHNRKSMEITDRLYGVTMEKAGMSKIVSVDIQGMKNQTLENPSDVQPAVMH